MTNLYRPQSRFVSGLARPSGAFNRTLFRDAALASRNVVLFRSGAFAFPRTTFTRNAQTAAGRAGSGAGSSDPYLEAMRAKMRQQQIDAQSTMMYVVAAIIFMSGLTYAAVPLYKVFCAVTGIDGTPVIRDVDYSVLKPVEGAKPIRISFSGDVSSQLGWTFTPQTHYLYVVPGETALAFFTATNKTKEDVIGVSTYSVVPAKSAQYFNKIQCFCFEEQKLLAGETVDMPVFFYIDPEFADDPWMADVADISEC